MLQEQHCKQIIITSKSEATCHYGPPTLKNDVFKSLELWVLFFIGSISCKNGKPRQSYGFMSGWKQLKGLVHELGLWISPFQHFQL
jgi:hypothetical protein